MNDLQNKRHAYWANKENDGWQEWLAGLYEEVCLELGPGDEP